MATVKKNGSGGLTLVFPKGATKQEMDCLLHRLWPSVPDHGATKIHDIPQNYPDRSGRNA